MDPPRRGTVTRMSLVHRHHLARLRRAPIVEWPFRVAQLWARSTDRWWVPHPTPPGPAVAWPWPDAGKPVVGNAFDGALAVTVWPEIPGTWLNLLGGADPRAAWVYTRLQVHAARAWAGDGTAAHEAEAFVQRYPPGIGIGWASGIEAALRLVSLVRISTRFPSPVLRQAVHAHAQWLLRHPSRGSSANNHRVAELAALALAARVLPEVAESRAFATAARELPHVLRAQLFADGAGVEQSPHYLAFDLEWALIARRCGLPELDEPLTRGGRFLDAMVDDTGETPALGDDDDGRVIPTTDGAERAYVASVVGAMRGPGVGADPRAYALGAPLLGPPEGRPRCFPDGGLTALRTGPFRVWFDHGPLGERHLAAHGHANALAVYVHGRSGPIVVGCGTGQYVGDPQVRRFHRGTGAHPTVCVDGADQSTPDAHPFLWRTRANAWLDALDLERQTVTATHNGYASRGVLHRRTVALSSRDLVVTDELMGRGRHHVSIRWPIAPTLEVDAALQIWDRRGRVARVVPDPVLDVVPVHGGPRPGPGWHAVRYGQWVPATTILCERVCALPARFVTVFELG